MLVVALLAATAFLAVAPARPSAAEDVTAAEAAQRARAAADGDGDALDDLRSITAVDGRPVDLSVAAGGDGADRAARLDALAEAWAGPGGTGGSEPTVVGDPAADRALAAEVLEDDRFQEPDLPRPFRGPLQWLGDRIGDAWDAAVRVLAPVFGTRGAALVLVAALLAAFVVLLSTLARRRSRGPGAAVAGSTGWLVDPALDPDDLESAADAAAAAGDHAGAVRLRYEAGLLRLVAAGRLDLRPDTTATGAAHQVDDPAMDELTAAFEEIVYGGRPATEADDRAARDGWRAVLGGSRRHAGRAGRAARDGGVAEDRR